MTNDEFKVEVKKLVEKLVQTSPGNNVFILVYNEETRIGFKFGYGCEGCAFEHMENLKVRGHFSHNRKDGKVH